MRGGDSRKSDMDNFSDYIVYVDESGDHGCNEHVPGRQAECRGGL
ncbi:hypothetical protein SAMN05421693_12047 [Ectothiorhodospira magna]|uniref:DUF3800 domain-containing protein n=1 Tax=Ectothiorhodospira magna TaxID=867345 RepID=A0A1H9E9C5_9GAMM|nr:hypothetical protein SAMN05421693_12047 [Ectothiorhodospira magna]